MAYGSLLEMKWKESSGTAKTATKRLIPAHCSGVSTPHHRTEPYARIIATYRGTTAHSTVYRSCQEIMVGRSIAGGVLLSRGRPYLTLPNASSSSWKRGKFLFQFPYSTAGYLDINYKKERGGLGSSHPDLGTGERQG
jgi:hypothetical protein